MKRIIVGIIVLLITLTACGSKAREPFQDSAVNKTNDVPADTITFPDGFSNAATKCDHGNRVYVLFHGDASFGAIAVVPADPTCK